MVDAGYEDHPVEVRNWYAADAFCQASGGRLPTEAEWEKAARGDQDTRLFPWGDELPDCNYANVGEYGECALGYTPVGSYPAGASVYGIMDMIGNIDEWVNDWYDSRYYYNSPYRNPTGPATEDYSIFKVYRGRDIRVSYRWNASVGSSGMGFRCAKLAD